MQYQYSIHLPTLLLLLDGWLINGEMIGLKLCLILLLLTSVQMMIGCPGNLVQKVSSLSNLFAMPLLLMELADIIRRSGKEKSLRN
jgi:hypothetical protein